MNNHYETLEIEINADQLQIKKAYRSLANRFHPDKNGNQEFFKNKFIEIKNAYDILIDPVSKLYYDTELRSYLNKINEDAEEKKQNSNSKFDENNSFFLKSHFYLFMNL